MSSSVRWVLSFLPTVWLLTGALLVAAPLDEPNRDAARLDQYTKPSGETFFSLRLAPGVSVSAPQASQVVVLFDTSASQVGPFREKGLDALQALLKNLGPHDRVRLLAVDLVAVPMCDGFVPPHSAEMLEAIARLRDRVPLGSTDMSQALLSAAASFGEPAAAGRAVIYIGDGMSRAHLLGTKPFAQLIGTLVKHRAAMSSYAIGPRTDSRLLAALANQTGGNLAIDREIVQPDSSQGVSEARASQENTRQAGEVGAYLAEAVHGTVLWPQSAAWPVELAEVYPKRVPPLRSDRDTVLIGSGNLEAPIAVKMTVEASGKTFELAWKVQSNPSSDDHAYLVQLVEMARRDDGVTLPTVGTAGLEETRRLIQAEVRNLTDLARHAVATGNLDNADLLAAEALRRDPDNPLARAVQGGTKKMRTTVADRAPTPEMRLAQAPAAGPAEDSLLDSVVQDGAFLQEVEQRQGLITQKVQQEVEVELRRARDLMSQNPQAVIDDLKLTLTHVKSVTELDPSVRAQLISRIESALKQSSRLEVTIDAERRLEQEREAAAQEQRRIVDRLTRDQEKLKQLLDRMNSLVAEGRYRLAEEEVGREVEALDPDGPVGISAVLNARTIRYEMNNRATTSARHRGFVDALEQVERSSAPFPDDPPIVYPDAEFWRELTLSRKKYATVDLKKKGSAEEKILEALEQSTNIEFVETPLRDVVEFLKEVHQIEIQLDNKALEEVGQGSDTPVTRSLKGITLKSALRLMLRDLELTYTIRDEVLLITTPDQVESHLVTKVYPVADLVLPIAESGFQGGFGGLGGFGGNQGAGGGQGFGQGGGGGGGGGFGGGGQGGGGGGFFNVPDENAPRPTEDLKLFKTSKTAPPAATPARKAGPSAADPKAAPSRAIAIDETQPADVFWKAYFKAHEVDAETLRETVRRLLDLRKLDHVVALCNEALRDGQPQPWMYETMALAMEARGTEKAEIERALMSAADFAESPDDLMYVADYLARLGLDARALQVYRQVAVLDPLRHDAYAHALRIAAERLDDLDGIRWATVGVLSQAWPASQAGVRDRAQRVAVATLERLRKEGHPAEAAAYQKELDAAVVRDCVVKVSWTGEADIDLLVEEPTGTICSRGSPRTTAGGVLLGDTFSSAGPSTAQGDSEIYVCPTAFSGTYRIRLRRVWGKVTAGRVTVDVYTGFRTPKVKHERQQILLGDEDHVVVFDVKDGRRQEPLAEHQIANAAVGQMNLGRAILAQQLHALSDPSVIEQLIGARDGEVLNRLRGGAVGFQPVIITLPEGTNFAATGVISADRRYVRITALPIFSGIGDVTTFTFAGASQEVQAGGMAMMDGGMAQMGGGMAQMGGGMAMMAGM